MISPEICIVTHCFIVDFAGGCCFKIVQVNQSITYHYYYTLIYHLTLLLHTCITYHYYYTLISLTITITHLYHLPLLLHTYISLTITITHLYHLPLLLHTYITLHSLLMGQFIYIVVRTFSVNWSVFSCFGNNVLLVPI